MGTTHRRHPILAVVIASSIGVAFGAASSGAMAASTPDGPPLGECTQAPPSLGGVQRYPVPPSDYLPGAGRTAPIPH